MCRLQSLIGAESELRGWDEVVAGGQAEVMGENGVKCLEMWWMVWVTGEMVLKSAVG